MPHSGVRDSACCSEIRLWGIHDSSLTRLGLFWGNRCFLYVFLDITLNDFHTNVHAQTIEERAYRNRECSSRLQQLLGRGYVSPTQRGRKGCSAGRLWQCSALEHYEGGVAAGGLARVARLSGGGTATVTSETKQQENLSAVCFGLLSFPIDIPVTLSHPTASPRLQAAQIPAFHPPTYLHYRLQPGQSRPSSSASFKVNIPSIPPASSTFPIFIFPN